jgi:hypothetical protein
MPTVRYRPEADVSGSEGRKPTADRRIENLSELQLPGLRNEEEK